MFLYNFRSSSNVYVTVKEKVKMLEQKVEEEFFQHEFMSNETSTGTTIRPEEIPGAVRVFPPPSPSTSRPGSRKGSLIMRSSSVDSSMFGASPAASPVNVPRSAQPSPIFTRKISNYKLTLNQVTFLSSAI
jgi:hypothetical protein